MSVVDTISVGQVAQQVKDSFGKIAGDSKLASKLRNTLLELLGNALDQETELGQGEKDQLQRANELASALLPFARSRVAGLYPDERQDPSVIEELRRAHIAFQIETKASC